jgi:hypothetical protein
MSEAEQDAVLERMLLEINEIYQGTDAPSISPDEVAYIQDFLLPWIEQEMNVQLRGSGIRTEQKLVVSPGQQSMQQSGQGSMGDTGDTATFMKQEPLPDASRHPVYRPTRKHGLTRFLQIPAAVLVIGALVGTMLVLLAPHRSEPGAGGVAEKGCIFSSNTEFGGKYYLDAVTALSRSDIWVVGNYNPPQDLHALLEHWNGSHWYTRPDPYHHVGMGSVDLHAVAADSTNDVWAVGKVEGDGEPVLIEHWNGTRWSIIPSPHPEAGSELSEVKAVSANNVWAVGEFTDGVQVQTLAVHWNGSSWSVIKSPNPGKSRNELRGVTALSANDIWAVGEFSNSTQGQIVEETLTLHWNGSRWSVVSSPSPSNISNDLVSVTALSANDVWAVGDTWAPSNNNLIEHWNGSRWSVVKSPNQGADEGLSAVARVPHANTILAVGVGLLLYINCP